MRSEVSDVTFSSIFNHWASEMFDSYVMKDRPSLHGAGTPSAGVKSLN